MDVKPLIPFNPGLFKIRLSPRPKQMQKSLNESIVKSIKVGTIYDHFFRNKKLFLVCKLKVDTKTKRKERVIWIAAETVLSLNCSAPVLLRKYFKTLTDKKKLASFKNNIPQYIITSKNP